MDSYKSHIVHTLNVNIGGSVGSALTVCGARTWRGAAGFPAFPVFPEAFVGKKNPETVV